MLKGTEFKLFFSHYVRASSIAAVQHVLRNSTQSTGCVHFSVILHYKQLKKSSASHMLLLVQVLDCNWLEFLKHLFEFVRSSCLGWGWDGTQTSCHNAILSHDAILSHVSHICIVKYKSCFIFCITLYISPIKIYYVFV